MWPLLAGAGLGLLKGSKDEAAANRDRMLQSVTARYSPWTGMKPTAVKEGDAFGAASQGALAGAQFGQGLDAAKADDAYRASELENMNLKNDYMRNNLNTPGMGSGNWLNRTPTMYQNDGK